METGTPAVPKAGRGPLTRWFHGDAYTIVAWLLFLVTAIFEWRGYVGKHEAIYLLGSRRVADPEFLANDITWSTLPPTSFIYDHLLAPLWLVFDDFGIVSVGRVLAWILLAWSLSMLARASRFPPWSVVVGFILWLVWDQTIALCGRPLEGIQPKLLAYPLFFFSLAFAMRGQMARAGIASGVATIFHIIIGGWAWLALSITMLINRALFSYRQLGIFLLSSLFFIGPLVIAVAFFHLGDISSDQRSLMDKIYVTFAAPHCCDPGFFMNPDAWLRALVIFPLAPALIFLWPHKRQARILACFIIMLVLFFAVGMLASELELHWLLKLFPFQLAKAIPALFLFILCLAMVGKNRPNHLLGQVVLIIGIIAFAWLMYQRDVFPDRVIKVQKIFLREVKWENPGESRYGQGISGSRQNLYAWIRQYTPPDSIFITPYLPEFWTYAEREQVASYRHPPFDQRLIDWNKRLEAINGFRSFDGKGFQIRQEITSNGNNLTVKNLVRIRELYGATHYLSMQRRDELSDYLLYSTGRYHIYDIQDL